MQAHNIDEVMAAHDKYLNGIVASCMLDDHTLGLRTALDTIFACCHRVLPLLRECDAQVTAKSSLLQQVQPLPRVIFYAQFHATPARAATPLELLQSLLYRLELPRIALLMQLGMCLCTDQTGQVAQWCAGGVGTPVVVLSSDSCLFRACLLLFAIAVLGPPTNMPRQVPLQN